VESPREIFRQSSYCDVVTGAGKFNASPRGRNGTPSISS
jgi:hypothetical protein